MRCCACDKILTEFELVLRAPESREFADLCRLCYDIAYEFEEDIDSSHPFVNEDINDEQNW